jgi:uncharacterized repeat protein (TIGR01451 family)
VSGATVTDTLPASLTGATWTCVGAGGGTCSASGSGSISDTVDLPVMASVTYTLTATIDASATGSLANTASVAALTDSDTSNNSATDTDTLTPETDLAITKTDGVTSVSQGQAVVYTIVASNAGPSASSAATVNDAVPAELTGVTWTCAGAGGGVCAPSGSGSINEGVVLPVGGSVTFTLTGTVSGSATGPLVNTATIAAAGGETDPVPGNDSATDTDTTVGCGAEVVAVPDGRLTDGVLPPGASTWVGASLRIGSSYSVEFKSTTGTVPPGTLTVFSGDDACSGTSTLVTTDTTDVDPSGNLGAVRQSFTATGTLGYFRARLTSSSGSPISYQVSWSETTLFSPAWSDFGGFDTFYSFQNTTGSTVNGRLTLRDTAGVEVISTNLTIPAGQTASVNTAGLGIARNQAGTAKFTHDGPPGSIVAEAAIANFSLSPAYVQTVKFQAVREAK